MNASRRIKRRLSADYRTPTKHLGTKAFGKRTKAGKRKLASKPSARALPSRTILHTRAVAAFSHFVMSADHTQMAQLVLSSAQKSALSLITWFERVSHLQWDKIAQQFRGKVDRTRLSIKAAAEIPISLSFVDKYQPPGSFRNKCWCTQPAMPGEDTCYTHHAG
jgi:hypothetical protein